MSDSLAASCADLARLLSEAAALIAQPDEDGTTGSGQPASRPPWNSHAAAAWTDATEGVRRLEASIRRDVTGHTGQRRGGSDANTMAALQAIEKLSYALPEHVDEYDANGKLLPCWCPRCAATAVLGRWARQISELPAVDESEPWRPLQGVSCPYCECTMLRIQPRAGKVTCLRHGACFDYNGQHPMGRIFVSHLDGSPRVAWNDGLVT